MYEEYYGFLQPPFSLTPDPRFLYRSESHHRALQQVRDAIRRKEAFIVLTGDIGTGKTTLSRTLVDEFDAATFTTLILDPFLSVEDLLRELLLSYGLTSKEALRSGRIASASRHELTRTLHDFLLSLVPLHGSAVLIIDEAQHLSTEVLEEIRILSNLETSNQKLLQIILVGQLNLLDVLRDARLRQLDQRISIRCQLHPLDRQEVEAYVRHRLAVAQGSSSVTFSPAAVDLVHNLTAGVPRCINLICDRALMAARGAPTHLIEPVHVREAATTLGLGPVVDTPPVTDAIAPARGVETPGRQRRAAWAALATGVALLLFATYTVGNPLHLLQPEIVPAQSAPPLSTPDPVVAAVTFDTPPALPTAPAGYFGYSVFVGAFSTPRDATRAEHLIRERRMPIYRIDARGLDGVPSRRLFVGRFPSKEEADAAQRQLASLFARARVTTAWEERFLKEY